ncbi:MAG: FecR domain-containing protein [Maribacter sp.]|uniref:FecR family protein n=1 Tax=Maribacter sp. TaxID=1897614 RepID=UPI003296EC13
METTTESNYESVALPDGSQVFLNHNSSISYAKEFKHRVVKLSGEAFFTVVPAESSFTVSTQYGDVVVLGTEFNVKTTSKQIAVDVKKGLVELKTDYGKSKIKKGIRAVYKEGEQAVKQFKSNKEYRKWIRSLQKELKKLGKDLKPVLKEIGDDFEKAGKKIGEEFKK